MGRYSTTTTIYRLLKGVPSTTSNDSLIQLIANRIGGVVDGYVGRWYNVSGWTTASSTPQLIQQISDSLVAMHTMRSLFTADAQNKNEWVSELGEQALKDLKAIQAQELIVLDSSGAETSRSSNAPLVSATRVSYTPVFDMDDDIEWTVDGDLSDKIADERS